MIFTGDTIKEGSLVRLFGFSGSVMYYFKDNQFHPNVFALSNFFFIFLFFFLVG